MVESDKGHCRRLPAAAAEEKKCEESPERGLLNAYGHEWSVTRSVSASPLTEHLALLGGDVLVGSCNLILLLLWRPTYYQEVSEDVRSEVVELPKPSIFYVFLFSLLCGFSGIFMKGLVLHWCLCQRLSCLPSR